MADKTIVVTVNVGVHPDLTPRIHVTDNGYVVASVATATAEGQVSLHADSLDDYHGWLLRQVAAVEALQEPVLPLDDVLSTHPAEVAG